MDGIPAGAALPIECHPWAWLADGRWVGSSRTLRDGFHTAEDRHAANGRELDEQAAVDFDAVDLAHQRAIRSTRFLRDIQLLQHGLSLHRHVEDALAGLHLIRFHEVQANRELAHRLFGHVAQHELKTLEPLRAGGADPARRADYLRR